MLTSSTSHVGDHASSSSRTMEWFLSLRSDRSFLEGPPPQDTAGMTERLFGTGSSCQFDIDQCLYQTCCWLGFLGPTFPVLARIIYTGRVYMDLSEDLCKIKSFRLRQFSQSFRCLLLRRRLCGVHPSDMHHIPLVGLHVRLPHLRRPSPRSSTYRHPQSYQLRLRCPRGVVGTPATDVCHQDCYRL